MESNRAERIGKFEMQVATRPHTPESEARWDRRADTLTAWLLSQWQAKEERGDGDRTLNN